MPEGEVVDVPEFVEPSPADRIRSLLEHAPEAADAVARVLGVAEVSRLEQALAGSVALSASELVEVAEVLGVPASVLSGQVPMSRHLGVSLRLGVVQEADAPLAALEEVERLIERKTLLDSWLGPVGSPLASVSMSTDPFHTRAGEMSAMRVRDGLRLGNEPITDLVGLVEELGFPVCFLPLPEDVHGLNIRDERGGTVSRVIVVSTNGPWTMQRYTLAHELCHALYDDEGQLIIDRVDVPALLPELRAESFARSLLMPSIAMSSEVREARRYASSWGTIVAHLMVRWGVSRRVVVRALEADALAEPAELAQVRDVRIVDLMRQADLSDEWLELSSDERVPSGSPMLVNRAAQAFGEGWVGVQVVADLLGVTYSEAEQSLRAAGWYGGGSAEI